MREVILNHLKRMEFVCGLKQFKEYDKSEAIELMNCLENLFRSFSWMNESRVDHILRYGLRGEYGEFYHVNERTVNGWINKYYQNNNSEIVREVIHRHHNQEKSTTQEEIDYWINVGKQTFRDKFEESKKTGIVPHLSDWGIYWFARMKEKGILNPDDYPVNEIKHEVRKELRLTERFIEETTVNARAKNKVWKLFIKDCISKQIDLTQYI